MAVDLSVFGRQKSIVDQQQLQQAFEAKKQAQQLQALGTVAALQAQLNPSLSMKDQMAFDIQRENLAAQRADRQENMDFRNQQADATNEFRRATLASKGTMIDPDTGYITTQPVNKPLPVGALKMQDEIIDAFSAAKSAQDLSQSLINKIDSGTLDLGPTSNLAYKVQNFAGASTPKSQAFGDMQTSIEKLRNDTLRLNKGVQTEGDAVRAMNEVISSANDPQLFKVNMEKLNAVNTRAAEIQRQKVDAIRSNYGAEPYDFGQIESMNAYADPNIQMVETPSFGDGSGNAPKQTNAFTSEAQAEAANLPKGTVITINGRQARVQ
jgi:hypothetical protein